MDTIRKLLSGGTLLVLFVGALAPFCAYCQTTAAPPTADQPAFDVASVKPSLPGAKTQLRRDPAGGITGASVDLKTLIILAFNIQDFQLVDLPSGMASERYDVIAKAPADAKKQETWVMLQALLADRFKLQTHREERQMTTYALTVSKKGFKLQPSTNPPGEADGSVKFGPGHISCIKVPMADLALVLSGVAGHRVIDSTGITGKYDLTLDWAPRVNASLPGSPSDSGQGIQEPEGPSLFAAVEDQLGLKLVPEKGPVEVIVIDHIERPSAN